MPHIDSPSRGVVVCARGELDMATVPVLRPVLHAQKGAVVLDLRGLEFNCAEGLRLMLDAEARARRDGLDLTLVPGQVTDRLLRLTGIRDRFRIGSPGA